MGDLQPGNGGGVPPDDGPYRDLPDLPPEWGAVVIPDDPAELEAEADEVRRELRWEAWRNRVRALVGLGPGRRGEPSLGVPLVIMSVAVITTLLSLFIVTWDNGRSTTPVGPDAALQQTAPPLPAVTLTDASGSRVRLGDLLPAILLLVEGCDCPELISDIAAATPVLITVVPVSAEAACGVGAEKNVRCLADPAGVITGRYPTAADLAPTPTPPPTMAPSVDASASPGQASPSPSASAAPPPTAVAVPVDGHGVAYEPIVVTSAGDLRAALNELLQSE